MIGEDNTLMGDLCRQYNMSEAIDNVGGFRYEPSLSVPDMNTSNLLEGYNKLAEKVQPIQWRSTVQDGLRAISLTCDPTSDDKDYDCCGDTYYTKYSTTRYYTAVEEDENQYFKGGYMDGLRYSELTPKVQSIPELKEFFDGFKVPVVRSTARTIRGGYAKKANFKGGYHTDGDGFQYLRLNICLTSDKYVGLQYENELPFFMSAGDQYVIMSHVMHRACVLASQSFLRTHFVIDVVPWFDFNDGVWTPNEFFGKKHPFDMIKDGDIYGL